MTRTFFLPRSPPYPDFKEFFFTEGTVALLSGDGPTDVRTVSPPFLHVFSSAVSEVPALLLLRGNPNSCFYFRTVVLRLQVKKHHCLAPQHRCSLGSSSSYPFPTLGRSVLHQEKELGHFFFSIWTSFWCVLDSALAEDCIAPSK